MYLLENLKISRSLCVFLSFFATSCTYVNRQEMIVNHWKVVSIKTQSKSENTDAKEPQLSPAYQIEYHFFESGKYVLHNAAQADSGKWQISTDDKVLVLQSFDNQVDNAEFFIEELNRYQMVLSLEEKGKKEIMRLTPLK